MFMFVIIKESLLLAHFDTIYLIISIINAIYDSRKQCWMVKSDIIFQSSQEFLLLESDGMQWVSFCYVLQFLKKIRAFQIICKGQTSTKCFNVFLLALFFCSSFFVKSTCFSSGNVTVLEKLLKKVT